jgi:hypothetical protein
VSEWWYVYRLLRDLSIKDEDVWPDMAHVESDVHALGQDDAGIDRPGGTEGGPVGLNLHVVDCYIAQDVWTRIRRRKVNVDLEVRNKGSRYKDRIREGRQITAKEGREEGGSLRGNGKDGAGDIECDVRVGEGERSSGDRSHWDGLETRRERHYKWYRRGGQIEGRWGRVRECGASS